MAVGITKPSNIAVPIPRKNHFVNILTSGEIGSWFHPKPEPQFGENQHSTTLTRVLGLERSFAPSRVFWCAVLTESLAATRLKRVRQCHLRSSPINLDAYSSGKPPKKIGKIQMSSKVPTQTRISEKMGDSDHQSGTFCRRTALVL